MDVNQDEKNSHRANIPDQINNLNLGNQSSQMGISNLNPNINHMINPLSSNIQNSTFEDKDKAFDDLDAVVIPTFSQQENLQNINLQSSTMTPTHQLGGIVGKSESVPVSEKKGNVDLLGEDFFESSPTQTNQIQQEVLFIFNGKNFI